MYNATGRKYKYLIIANQVNHIFYVNIFLALLKINPCRNFELALNKID